MVIEKEVVAAYGQLMEISRKMLDCGQYEAAFHALHAALYCAAGMKDEQCLLAVQQEAENQRDLIDTVAPVHRLSSPNAASRGGRGVYELLVQQAIVYSSRMKQEFRKQELETLTDTLWNS